MEIEFDETWRAYDKLRKWKHRATRYLRIHALVTNGQDPETATNVML